MKIVYVSHAISGDIEKNLFDLRRIVRHINLTMPDVVPLCAYYADIVSLDDNNPTERARGISNDMELIKRRFIDELWLTGSRLSNGMINEKNRAELCGITVIDKLNLL